MPKTSFLIVRLEPRDRERLEAMARANYLDASAWARQVLLRELEALDRKGKKGKKGD